MKDLSRKVVLVFALLLSAALAFSASASEYEEGDVIVVLRPSEASSGGVASSALRVASFAAAEGAWVKETYPELSKGSGIYAVIHSDTRDAQEFAEELKSNPEVLAASPNYKVYAAKTPNDPEVSEAKTWGLYDIGAPSVWDTSTGSHDIYVAVIDTGIDSSNPDLDNVSTEYSYSTDTNLKDTHGHGTHVAGVIGARGNNGKGIAGVNWDVQLISVRVLTGTDGNGQPAGTVKDVIKGINYVTGLLNNGVNIKAVNMSLETYIKLVPGHDNFVKDPFWRALKDLSELNKAVMVVAAGNSAQTVGQPNTEGKYVYPASFAGLDNMITVGALNKDGSLASFSNKGADVAAPGVAILSTWLQTGTTSEVALKEDQGTSMAAPFVSGAAALLASISSDITAYQLKQAILGGSTASVSGSEKVETSAGEKKFSLSGANTYMKDNAAKLSAKPGASEYDDYADYKVSKVEDLDYYQNNSFSTGGGGGGCNAGAGFLAVGIFASLVMCVKRGKIFLDRNIRKE